MQTGLLEVTSMVNLPRAARKICATFCPKLHISEPEYVVAGGEDTNVYIFDISRPSSKPIVVNQLQVSMRISTHAAQTSCCQRYQRLLLAGSYAEACTLLAHVL